jgi:ABC-type branched-subunit amino acid transport system substrate-binding protein
MSERPRVVVAFLVGLALVLSACGQKSGVAGTEVSTGETPATTAGGDGGDGGDGGGSAAHTPGPDDTSGVTDDEIVIGIHAPVTGASPIPQETFETGKDVYWKFLAESQPEALGGRKVRAVFRDDEFNPNRAVQVCREMVEQENAFVLVGGGGADQITACAKYADEAGVPYFSAGVNESDLSDLSTYYALSLTYSQQVPLLLRLVDELGAERVGVVINDTPSFADAHDTFVAAAEDAGLDVVVDDSINKVASEAEALAEIGKLKQADAEVVFLLVSPLVYLSVASAARNQNYDPVFIGPGITNGLNAVTRFGCPAVGNGQYFSPFPELDVINELDPDYEPAYQQFGGGGAPDDIGIALWGLNKILGLMFEATGDDLGRAALMNTIEEGDTFESNVYPPVAYEPDQHFGGSGAHLLEADCADRQYTTKQQFVELGEGS